MEAEIGRSEELVDSGVQIEDAGSALMVYCEAAPDMNLLRSSVMQIADGRGLRRFARREQQIPQLAKPQPDPWLVTSAGWAGAHSAAG